MQIFSRTQSNHLHVREISILTHGMQARPALLQVMKLLGKYKEFVRLLFNIRRAAFIKVKVFFFPRGIEGGSLPGHGPTLPLPHAALLSSTSVTSALVTSRSCQALPISFALTPGLLSASRSDSRMCYNPGAVPGQRLN